MKAGDLCKLSVTDTASQIISWWAHKDTKSWCVRESFEYCKDDVHMYICNHELAPHERSDPYSSRTLIFCVSTRQFHYVTNWLVKQI